MQVIPFKTHKISPQEDLFGILDKYLPKLGQNSVVAVTSKIVSLCEGRVVAIDESNPEQKDTLIESEAAWFLPRNENPYNVSLTITKGMLSAGAGIDESNGNGYYILWPENPQESANRIREHVVKTTGIEDIGVIITDSKTTAMRWGVTAIALAFSGIKPLKNYINTPDIYGRPFVFEQMSIIDNLACSAALVMGEGAEQTPLSVITDIPMVEFTRKNPSEKELKELEITMDTDLYGKFLKSAPWKKGKGH